VCRVRAAAPQAPREVPTFHVFASEWFERQKVEGGRRGEGLSDTGRAALQWVISNHLLPTFACRRLDQITVEDVDRYRLGKVREGKLSATSINKTLATLAAILEAAVEYGLIGRNPARGRRRRLPAVPPRRSWLDRADHIAALLDAAGQRDRTAKVCRGQRRALLATLVFAGLRIGEALSLRWRDVDLARGTITVRAAKTDAGVRIVNVLPVLRSELGAYRARLDPTPDTLVFGTAIGRQQGATNVRRRVLAKAVEQANRQLTDARAESLPEGLTPHSLRRTFASLLFALGEGAPLRHGADGTHHPEPHAGDLRPADEPPRRRVGSSEGARRGT
jgi:integrase